ncbi:MAG: tetraacyldisaccharide 4'-kinase [Terriglobales bacterium]|jgi:tetraacyldisaccharide 4'-kinase
MNPLTGIYGAVVQLRNALYDRRILHARRLQGPVISVGNLSVGGSGKTPFVIVLGKLLMARGIPFDILTRGYGRSGHEIAEVDPNGQATKFGDEPLLLARSLGVPVIVGADRYQAGLFAERQHGPRLHLLDDGFQHRRLARDFDIVMLAAYDLHDRLLPLGRLRETPEALCRADAIVLTEQSPGSGSGRLSQTVGDWRLGTVPVWHVRRRIEFDDVPLRPIAFCGIARPHRFFEQLQAAGIAPAAEKSFSDHHAYLLRDVEKLLSLKERSGAAGFVTTEKDAINLGELAGALQPLCIVRTSMTLIDPEAAMEAMLKRVAERRNGN